MRCISRFDGVQCDLLPAHEGNHRHETAQTWTHDVASRPKMITPAGWKYVEDCNRDELITFVYEAMEQLDRRRY